MDKYRIHAIFLGDLIRGLVCIEHNLPHYLEERSIKCYVCVVDDVKKNVSKATDMKFLTHVVLNRRLAVVFSEFCSQFLS